MAGAVRGPEKNARGEAEPAGGAGMEPGDASFCQVNSFSQGARIPGATRQKWKLPRGDRKLEPAGKGALSAAP